MTDPKETALERVGPQSTALAGRLTVNDIEEQFKEYLELQKRLDQLMPDQIMEIGKGKDKRKFRKKGYWRAIKKWAGLSVEILEMTRIEEKVSFGGPAYDDWGYTIKARVTSPSGQTEDGDGTCMRSEKFVWEKDWDKWRANGKKGPPPFKKDSDGRKILDEFETAKNATKHNVIGHATTRAKNRAISDMSGFGEVSAEELPPEAKGEAQPDREEKQQAAQRRADTEAQPQQPSDVIQPDVFPYYDQGDAPTVWIPYNAFKKVEKENCIYVIDGKECKIPKAHIKRDKNGSIEITEQIAKERGLTVVDVDAEFAEESKEELKPMFVSEQTLDVLWNAFRSSTIGNTEAEMIAFAKFRLKLDGLKSLENLTEDEAQKLLGYVDKYGGNEARQTNIPDGSGAR